MTGYHTDQRQRKITLLLLLAACLVCGLTVPMRASAKKNGWKDGYYYEDGDKVTDDWVKSGGNRYYLDSNGKKLTGWHKIDGAYYFFNQKGNNYESGKPKGAMITELSGEAIAMGIDVSTWQGDIDWAQVKAAGVKFVMIRVGYGKGRYGTKHCTVDDQFREYAQGAAEVGIPIGIYFYSYATNEEQALSEAEFTIKQLDGIPVSFPVAYDIEDSYILGKTTTAQRTAMVKTYMDTIAAAGYTPMFYCNQNWYNRYLNAEDLAEYEFWYARYTNREPDSSEYPYSIWQATSTQRIKGITENTVDIDFLYEDYGSEIETRTKACEYGWHRDGLRWQYYYQGSRKTDGWMTIGGYSYYLTTDGAAEGWQTIDGNRYYFNSRGQMQTGLVRIGLSRYLFDDDGVLQLTTDEPGLTIDADGVCHVKKGWYQADNGKYFYRKRNGSIAKNCWIRTKGKKYYVGKNGYRTTGFRTIGGKRYYFKKNGEMVHGKTMTINGKRYTFRKNGQIK